MCYIHPHFPQDNHFINNEGYFFPHSSQPVHTLINTHQLFCLIKLVSVCI